MTKINLDLSLRQVNLLFESLETFSIGESLRVELRDCSTKYDEYFGFDFVDSNNDRYETYMSRDKLRGLAVFILKYLENN